MRHEEYEAAAVLSIIALVFVLDISKPRDAPLPCVFTVDNGVELRGPQAFIHDTPIDLSRRVILNGFKNQVIYYLFAVKTETLKS